MTDSTARNYAERLIQDARYDIEYLSVSEYVNFDLEDDEEPDETLTREVDELIRTARITVSWEDA